MKKRKIAFYYILLRVEELEMASWDAVRKVCAYLVDMDKSDRKKDLEGNKFAFLSTFRSDSDEYLEVLFKSAKHSYRAPLLNRNTVEERENPKTLEEGEQVKTHVLLKHTTAGTIALIETGNNLMTGKNINEYLNFGLRLYNSSQEEEEKIQGYFSIQMIASDNFEEVLSNMSKITCASIYIDKTILGSSGLDFAEETETMQNDIEVQIKAKRKKSILDMAYQLVDKFKDKENKIRRIRFVGRNTNNNETILDTDFLIKKEFVEVSQNADTGEFNTYEMFRSIKELATQFK